MTIKLRDFEIGKDKLTILAGPCAVESLDIMRQTAEGLKRVCEKLDINYIFKCSYDKANRSSINSYRGLGMEKGLEPAFLCRQTDLLIAAAKTGKIVNIKKGQFLAPQQMKSLVKKVEDSGNHQIMLTDRGVTFGYNNLVSDFRAIPIMKEFGYPVVFDATHSVQKPGGKGNATGGNRENVEPLAKAAVAAGADALFLEVHQDPDHAKSDGPNMVRLDEFEELLKRVIRVYEAVH